MSNSARPGNQIVKMSTRLSRPVAQVRPAGEMPGPRAARTIAAILEGTRQVFLLSGYTGTTIDGITRAAGVSRSSFYTYFASKRDALLALGAESLASAMTIIGQLSDLGSDADADDIAHWVSMYFGHLEEHGSFAFAWTQAAQLDTEIRRAGQRGHLEMCRRLGVALAKIHGASADAPIESGLLIVGMLERVWAYSQLYGRHVDRVAVEHIAVRLLLEVEKPRAPDGSDDPAASLGSYRAAAGPTPRNARRRRLT